MTSTPGHTLETAQPWIHSKPKELSRTLGKSDTPQGLEREAQPPLWATLTQPTPQMARYAPSPAHTRAWRGSSAVGSTLI
jgi:hypothetical protein